MDKRTRAVATSELRPVDMLQEHLQQLVAERQRLRADGARAEALERNRKAIASAQRELSAALVARHRGVPAGKV